MCLEAIWALELKLCRSSLIDSCASTTAWLLWCRNEPVSYIYLAFWNGVSIRNLTLECSAINMFNNNSFRGALGAQGHAHFSITLACDWFLNHLSVAADIIFVRRAWACNTWNCVLLCLPLMNVALIYAPAVRHRCSN